MRKLIRKREYDTEASRLIRAFSFGALGDPRGYEEDLYQSPDGAYFLHVGGGPESPYPQEDILHLAKAKVKKWLETH